MRHLVAFLVVALLAPSFAAAQSTAADGIRALARGDTEAALRILKPLADAPEPDPLAQFFVATLHDTGSGVAMDPIRACGLYLKSATNPKTNPLASQALALADTIRRVNPRIAALCEAASLGVWREPSPATFVLGPGHKVTTDAPGFTVDYQGIKRAVPTTWGGIDAFVRGDYPRAAQILKPIAERWPGQIDDAALFFMATLYANGLGLPRNIDRACALYMRSSRTGPFARLNAAMFTALQPTLTADEQADCLMLAVIGFDHRFEPATFSLESGDWIKLELSSKTQTVSATVAYQGKEKRTDVSAAVSPGVIFLPIRHTELEVGGAAPTRRHFIEVVT